MNGEKILYAIQEACISLSIGRTKIFELMAEGSLRGVKVGRRTLIHRDELERFAKQLESR